MVHRYTIFIFASTVLFCSQAHIQTHAPQDKTETATSQQQIAKRQQDALKAEMEKCKSLIVEQQEKVKNNYPIFYPAAQEGIVLGAVAGAAKRFTPTVFFPRRCNSLLLCVAIGAAGGAAIDITHTAAKHMGTPDVLGVMNRSLTNPEKTAQAAKEMAQDVKDKAVQGAIQEVTKQLAGIKEEQAKTPVSPLETIAAGKNESESTTTASDRERLLWVLLGAFALV